MLPLALGALVLFLLATSRTTGTNAPNQYPLTLTTQPRIDPPARYRVVSPFLAHPVLPSGQTDWIPRIVGVGETIRANNNLIAMGEFYGGTLLSVSPSKLYGGVDPTTLAASIEFVSLV